MSIVHIPKQINDLVRSCTEHANEHGEGVIGQLQQAAHLLVLWLQYLQSSQMTGNADSLLDGVRSALIETAGSLALGLVRSSLFAMRAQIDLILGWLYFKDHPVEWRLVQDTGDGFRLKRDCLRYLEDVKPKFKQRLTLLSQAKRRLDADPYRLLSYHVHGQLEATVPRLDEISQMVLPASRDACVVVQEEVVEYIGDVLLSCFASHWASLPEPIVDELRARLSPQQLTAFFS